MLNIILVTALNTLALAAPTPAEKVVSILKQGKGSQFSERLDNATRAIRAAKERPVPVFLSVAQDKRIDDPIRYQALMGVALAKDELSVEQRKSLLKMTADQSWMIRLGLAKSAGHLGLQSDEIASLLSKLNQDVSLVVRSEVLESVGANAKLIKRPIQIALVQEALDHPANYVRTKAQVVPYKALSLIDLLKLDELRAKVSSIAQKSLDVRMKAQAQAVLSRLK